MVAVVECPKCGGEMREGDAFVRVTIPGSQASSGLGMTSMTGLPGIGLPTAEATSEERLLWRERTGRKTGWLMKSEEMKSMKISGRRCTACGYIELHAQE